MSRMFNIPLKIGLIFSLVFVNMIAKFKTEVELQAALEPTQILSNDYKNNEVLHDVEKYDQDQIIKQIVLTHF